MIVLGIDPGTAALGFGVVERRAGRLRMVDVGCLITASTETLPDRLLAIHRLVVELIELHQPDLLAVERLFFSKNAQTAFAVGQARGVVLLAGAAARVPVREATPNEVKSAVTGYGAADKEQVGRMVATVLGLATVPRPDDAADALAVAVWAANAERDLNGGVGSGAARSGVLDLSSVAPARGESSYERAVREALARDKSAKTATRAKTVTAAKARTAR